MVAGFVLRQKEKNWFLLFFILNIYVSEGILSEDFRKALFK